MHHAAAIVVFALVYSSIIAGEKLPRKIDRPAAGLMGAVLLVVTGALSRSQALAAIDFGTLSVLFGMMVVIHFAITSGLLNRATSFILSANRSPRHLLWIVCATAGILSALFVNDTICLLMTPIVLAVLAENGLPAEPFLLGVSTSSNVGSLMTLTGNPQNILIGQSTSWTWSAFALRMAPLGLLCMTVNAFVLDRSYRAALKGIAAQRPRSIESTPFDRKLAIKTIVAIICLLAAFLMGAPLDIASLAAAVIILVLANRAPEEAFASVDWSLLLFFAGLFIVVDGFARNEGYLMNRLAILMTGGSEHLPGLLRFSAFSAIGSNLFSNVPFVMLLRSFLAHTPNAPLLALALAASSTLAGNLTIVGSVANLIVAHGARAESPLSFRAFARVGIPSTCATIVLSAVVLWFYHRVGWA